MRRAEVVGELALGAELAEAVGGLPVHAGRTGHALAAAAGLPAGSTISVVVVVKHVTGGGGHAGKEEG